MAAFHLVSALVLSLCLQIQRSVLMVDAAIGVNWGTLSSHRLQPSIVVDLMKDNKISKVKLFDADPTVLRALVGSGIQVMLGIPNDMLGLLGSSPAASDLWVSQNVSRYLVKGGVDIRYFWVFMGLNLDSFSLNLLSPFHYF